MLTITKIIVHNNPNYAHKRGDIAKHVRVYFHYSTHMITLSTTLKKEPVPPLVKIREVAKLLSVSRATVHALIQSGDLKASEIIPLKRKSVSICA